MEIAIKIPEEIMEYIKNNGFLSVFYIDEVAEAIKNGTPLPKGHGRLIDVNDLLDRIGLEDNDTNREENVGEIITLEDFDYTPTIIKADKESEEE